MSTILSKRNANFFASEHVIRAPTIIKLFDPSSLPHQQYFMKRGIGFEWTEIFTPQLDFNYASQLGQARSATYEIPSSKRKSQKNASISNHPWQSQSLRRNFTLRNTNSEGSLWLVVKYINIISLNTEEPKR